MPSAPAAVRVENVSLPSALRAIRTYRWGNNARRAELKGRACTVLARGAKGSVLLLFPDTGERVVSSWRAVA